MNYPFTLPQGTTPLSYDEKQYATAAAAFDALLALSWCQYMEEP
jgi:hypothetical protein